MNIYNYNKDFFVCLIGRLNCLDLNYAIIGDYQSLPESIGHDIDMWTSDVKAFR